MDGARFWPAHLPCLRQCLRRTVVILCPQPSGIPMSSCHDDRGGNLHHADSCKNLSRQTAQGPLRRVGRPDICGNLSHIQDDAARRISESSGIRVNDGLPFHHVRIIFSAVPDNMDNGNPSALHHGAGVRAYPFLSGPSFVRSCRGIPPGRTQPRGCPFLWVLQGSRIQRCKAQPKQTY
jgi:hypothetical protein